MREEERGRERERGRKKEGRLLQNNSKRRYMCVIMNIFKEREKKRLT